jgi:hypothetical protein
MTQDCNSVSFGDYLLAVKVVLARDFGLAAGSTAVTKAAADHKAGIPPHRCAAAIARDRGPKPR